MKKFRILQLLSMSMICLALAACTNSPTRVLTEEIPQPSELTEESAVINALVTGTLIDPRDGQSYKTVTLNGKRWLAQNLNYTIPANYGQWFWGNNPANGPLYGRLYSAYNIKNNLVSIPGWHVPSDAELTSLEKYVGNLNAFKDTSWPPGTNTSGFGLKAGGYINQSGNSVYLGSATGLWTSSASTDLIYHRYTSTVNTGVVYQSEAFYVRLVESSTVTLDALDKIGSWVAFNGSLSTVNISISTSNKVAGTGSLKMTLNNKDYAGTGFSYTTKPNWTMYTLIKIWMKGSASGKQIRFEIADAEDERYEYLLSDSTTTWKQFVIPLSSFTRRTDWQPAGVPNNGLTLSAVRGLSLAPKTTGIGTWYFDQLQLQ